jgi:hypothetical protein
VLKGIDKTECEFRPEGKFIRVRGVLKGVQDVILVSMFGVNARLRRMIIEHGGATRRWIDEWEELFEGVPE